MRRIGWVSFAALVALGLLLVGCRDVQIGPHSQRGNQLGLDAVRMAWPDHRHWDPRQQWHRA